MVRPCEVIGHADLGFTRLAPIATHQFKQPFRKSVRPQIAAVGEASTRREQIQRESIHGVAQMRVA